MRVRSTSERLRRALCVTVFLLLCGSCGQCCGPGRGGGRRRAPRRLMPLVFKQHVPNVAENTLGASGLTEGKISRNDPRFGHLVPNYNKDILFSDEEGTGADRIMTERCKERLNALAIGVMNHWPGVRLRVTEAWDEGSLHAPNSLHYEGRAVDITTSDKDLSKHGMLARLAVQVGFDWVYYESRSRIHCSVKSESKFHRKLGGCFPGYAKVDTPQGPVPMATIRQGTLIRVLREDGSTAFSPVMMFLHEDPTLVRSFLTLVTQSKTLTVTPSHLVFALRQERAFTLRPTLEDALRDGHAILAGGINPGDFLLVTGSNGSVFLERLIDMRGATQQGVFAPLTREGTVVVDGIVASCYAVIDSQKIAHLSFLPVRLYYELKDYIIYILHFIGVTSELETDYKVANYRNNFNRFNANYITNSSKFDYNDDYPSPMMSFSKDVEQHIHWYPRLLYSVATWILPRHLVYS